MSFNLPPGVSDYDLPGYNEFDAERDVVCPECSHEQKDAHVIGDFDPRWGNQTVTFFATCEKCGADWEFTEDRRDV